MCGQNKFSMPVREESMVTLTIDEVASEFWQGNFTKNSTRPEYEKEGT